MVLFADTNGRAAILYRFWRNPKRPHHSFISLTANPLCPGTKW